MQRFCTCLSFLRALCARFHRDGAFVQARIARTGEGFCMARNQQSCQGFAQRSAITVAYCHLISGSIRAFFLAVPVLGKTQNREADTAVQEVTKNDCSSSTGKVAKPSSSEQCQKPGLLHSAVSSKCYDSRRSNITDAGTRAEAARRS